MASQSPEQLLLVKRQASLSGSSSADGGAETAECSSSAADFLCPYCYENSLPYSGLVDHIMDHHSFAQRSVKCPICRRPARDMVQHLLQHSQGSSRPGPSHSFPSSSSRSSKDRMSGLRLDCERTPSEWDSYSEGTLEMPSSSVQPPSSAHMLSTPYSDAGLPGMPGLTPLSVPAAATSAPAAVQQQAPPAKPRPAVKDTPELRSKFLEQLLLSAFELDWR
ncbi:hypothetical protein WJX73_008163 [Symbiochloris irregularis]|uniref:Di19 zinc-binding domain-containing protein n=1 Tax=Symbiochloris irregularis TaxID=706552 RepID=A0AAW1NIM8_9CHLO